MSTIERIQRLVIPGEDVIRIAKIYYELGYLDENADFRTHDIDIIKEQNIEADTFFLGLLLGLNVNENRSRLIVTKNSLPRSKDETILAHLKEIMGQLANSDNFNYSPRDYYNLINYIYNADKIGIQFTDAVKEKKTATTLTSKKALWEELDSLTAEKENQQLTEPICLYLHYWLDIFNMTPLNAHNDTLTYLLLYVCLLKAHVNFFKYTSLFELIYQEHNHFLEEVRLASVNWADGYNQTGEFMHFMLDLIIKASHQVAAMVKRYDEEQMHNKSDALEKTILSFKNPFTKADIREQHPLVSDSTIQRSLAKLQDEHKITSLGKGRTAQWLNKTAIITKDNTENFSQER